MQFKDKIKVTGSLHIKKMDKNNNVIQELDVPNLVVDAGKEYIASRLAVDSGGIGGVPIVDRMSIGINNTPTTELMTNLLIPVASNAFESVAINTPLSGTVLFTCLFDGDTSPGFIAEAGIFNSTAIAKTIDSANITLMTGSLIGAGSFVIGATYEITSVGSTDFTAIGAATNTIGVIFIAEGVGEGSGTATEKWVEISDVAHGYTNGEQVTYTESSTAIAGLISGQTYYISIHPSDPDIFYLSKSYTLATQTTPVYIGGSVGVGVNHIFTRYTVNTLLCRSTFPVVAKNPGESISISWTVTVG